MTAASRDRWPLILGLWAAPASIAVSEFFLSVAALIQLVRLVRRQIDFRLPQCLWFWLIWVGMEIVVWGLSPNPVLGWSEIRHLLLLAVVFFVLSGFDRASELLLAWKGVFVSATASSLVLIGEFLYRLQLHREDLAAGGDAGFYLRSGGLLHHWMVYASVEIVVVAGLISFWSAYPFQRRRWWPVLAVNGIAVVLSLTRAAWITCLLLAGISLIWKRSRWLLAVPLLLLVIYGLSPDALRSRVSKIADLTYYSNSERLQMIAVGWRMLSTNPLTGVGPGHVESLYESYLKEGEPVPAYHGHLHNNLMQIAAQFGFPVTFAALVFVAVTLRDLIRARKKATSPDGRFLTEAALLAMIGFLFAGLFEYTWGHSLALIMIAFGVVPALVPKQQLPS